MHITVLVEAVESNSILLKGLYRKSKQVAGGVKWLFGLGSHQGDDAAVLHPA